MKAGLEALRDTDVRSLLPRIRTPTLILHRRADRAVCIEAGRHLGDAIPRSRFVALDGKDHWLWAGEQSARPGTHTQFPEPAASGCQKSPRQ